MTNPAALRAICPGCDTSQRIEYDAMTDEVTCWKCGLVSTVNEVRAHHTELKKAAASKPKTKLVRLGELRAIFVGSTKSINLTKRATAPKQKEK